MFGFFPLKSSSLSSKAENPGFLFALNPLSGTDAGLAEQRKPRADVETLLTSQTISSLCSIIPLVKRERPQPSSLPCAGRGLYAAGLREC